LTIAKIEKGGTRARNASLQEVLAIAAALNVGVVHLFVPLEDDASVEIAPKFVASAPRVREWVRGLLPLRDRDVGEFVTELPDRELRTMLETSMTRGLGPLEAMLMKDRTDEAIQRVVDEIRNPKGENDE
jgi:hypothetical protein